MIHRLRLARARARADVHLSESSVGSSLHSRSLHSRSICANATSLPAVPSGASIHFKRELRADFRQLAEIALRLVKSRGRHVTGAR